MDVLVWLELVVRAVESQYIATAQSAGDAIFRRTCPTVVRIFFAPLSLLRSVPSLQPTNP